MRRRFTLLLCLLFFTPSVAGEAFAEPKTPTKESAKKKSKDSKKKAKKAKSSKKDAAFIIVKAPFKTTTVTVNDVPYPQNSKVGAVVSPNKSYVVVVTDTTSNTTKRYKVKLEKGEARVFIVDFSSASGSSSAPKSNKATASSRTPKKEKAAEGDGFLTVNANPEGQVYVDGKLVASKTPLTKYPIKEGTHSVRVYYVEQRKFSETKRAKVAKDKHVNLFFND